MLVSLDAIYIFNNCYFRTILLCVNMDKTLICTFCYAILPLQIAKTNTIYQVDCLGFHLHTVYIHESNVRGSAHHLFLQQTYFFEALFHKFKKPPSNFKLSP